MAEQVLEYKCPACTGPLHFDSESGKLTCDYCGSSYTVGEIEARYGGKQEEAENAFSQAAKEPSWDTSSLKEDWGEDGAKMKMYTCPSCGAQILCEETTAVTSCPYCGNNTIVPGQFEGILKPDFVLPFKLDKDAAIAALKRHCRRKFLLPRSFTAENHLEEIKGIYVPFWLFDADADADCYYHATRSHSHTEGDYRVTVTEHFDVRRSGSIQFSHIPADGSKKMPDDYMDSIEPFDYGALKPFSIAYLPGYLADKYDVNADACMARVDTRMKNAAAERLRREVTGYETVASAGDDIRLRHGEVHYTLLPVWTLRTKWQNEDYLFMMNGESGKMVGNLPVSMTKAGALFAVLAAALCALFLKTGLGQFLAEIFFA